MNSKPLAGAKILNTRPLPYQQSLTTLLEEQGAEVFAFPLLDFVAPSSWDGIDNYLNSLKPHDWTIITSVTSINFLLQRCQPEALTGQWAVIGMATAATLRQYGVEPQIIAAEPHAQGLVNSWLDYFEHNNGTVGKVWLLRAALASDTIPEKLTAAGFAVEVITAYRNVPHKAEFDKLAGLFNNKKLDWCIFTSPLAIKHFMNGLNAYSIDSSALNQPNVACLGPVTADEAAKVGLKVSLIAKGTMHSLVKNICAWKDKP